MQEEWFNGSVIDIQNNIIERLKDLNRLLSKKSGIIQSTELSKNDKIERLENEINPQLEKLNISVSKLDSKLDNIHNNKNDNDDDDDDDDDTDTDTELQKDKEPTPWMFNEDDDQYDESQFYDISLEGLSDDEGYQDEMENVARNEPNIIESDPDNVFSDNESISMSENRVLSSTPSLSPTRSLSNEHIIISSDDDENTLDIMEVDDPIDQEEIVDLEPILSDEDLLPSVLSSQIQSSTKKVIGIEEEEKEIHYKWTDELYLKLNKIFRLLNFRNNQLKAINSTLSGKDVFVLMPTGGGKSLCYQLPAIIKNGKTHGTSIVVSPLVSLMQDQVDHLLALGIKATNLNSRLNAQQKSFVFQLLVNGDLDLLYISPEMINASTKFQTVLQSLFRTHNLSRIIIDEAHCVSSWGHDFRPDYKQLNYFKDNFPNIPIMALTATANSFVINDIIKNLKFNQTNMTLLRQSFNRDNLFYQILPKNSNTKIMVDTIKNFILENFKNQTGIIYCHSKKSCEEVSEMLTNLKIKSAAYHAGMSANERIRVQKSWQDNIIQVICATVAFGMGIDKPDVRFVMHFTIPRSLESYYQETGRAGRDGRYSYCITFYSFKDVRKLQKMIQIDKSLNKENKTVHLNKLQQVMTFCENQFECRRNLILNYFDEKFDSNFCFQNCDNCAKKDLDLTNTDASQIKEQDITETALQIIDLVDSLGSDRVTVINCQEIFKGSKSAKIVQAGYAQLRGHGLGKEWSKQDLERIFFYLITLKVLQEYSVMNKCGYGSSYVKLGPEATKLRNKKLNITMKFNIAEKRSKPSKTDTTVEEKPHFIKILRNRKANRIEAPVRPHQARPRRVHNATYVTTYKDTEVVAYEHDLEIVRQLKEQQCATEKSTRSSGTKSSTKGHRRKTRRYRRGGRSSRKTYRARN
ncbi:similar to Saccharomyces cerevisiae YMR190C SGS1 Nucleolar DNA helicase of the RecQ family [Maudiozyma saulgeensis]|uniref:ATP-dependent DNA helicase n=1 Tax=Maudiozyma saulgeensis TaxID=1789683 RepID=A0A1X7R8J5_9SACH|nr:similar to Saccharomyces cerevisiae YMR190C SGS1 Nucleolar DNA helicase of the RecQ family [Kazachstania saulgeensis]